ncbi:MAG: hypothetical protein ACRDRU_08840 [Pseudonocardiaceae bacterium]
MNGNEDRVRFSPDGLTEQIIDVLLTELDVTISARPRPASALMDGTAAQRQHRRQARRSAAAVVRTLPLHGAISGCDGTPLDGSRTGYGNQPDGDGPNPRDMHDTRPGGPNRQAHAHRVGAPESLTHAIEEIGTVRSTV